MKKDKWVKLNKFVKVKNPRFNGKGEVICDGVIILDDKNQERIKTGFLDKDKKF